MNLIEAYKMSIFTVQKGKTTLPKLFVLFLLCSSSLFSQSSGEKIFKSVCRACHTIGQGRLVGPDLSNVQNRLKDDWLIKFVKSSQSMVKSGDAEAVKVFNDYNKIVMPDQPFSDAEITSILKYISSKSPKTNSTAKTKSQKFTRKNTLGFYLNEAGKDEYLTGEQYFNGKKRFEKNGPACTSCHNVGQNSFLSGGILAKDLTKAFTRLNAAGVDAIISSPPFPAMKTAFENKQLTNDEKYYLLAYLKYVDFQGVNQPAAFVSKPIVYTGIIGVVLLFGFFEVVWFGRKKDTVKKDIFKRQLKS